MQTNKKQLLIKATSYDSDQESGQNYSLSFRWELWKKGLHHKSQNCKTTPRMPNGNKSISISNIYTQIEPQNHTEPCFANKIA